jgi:hypothetical protein
MKRLLWLLLLGVLCLPLECVRVQAQITLTTSNTVTLSNATRPWIDAADPNAYGNGQIYRDLFLPDGGRLPQLYNQNSWACSTGATGGTPTTTSWPTGATGGNGTATSYSVASNVVTITGTFSGLAANSKVQFSGFTSATFLNNQTAYLTSASGTTITFPFTNADVLTTSDTGGVYVGYPPNYFVGASYYAYNASTGASYGTGTITASTATTSAHGIVFTPSAAFSSACSNNDVMIVELRTPSLLMTPFQLFAGTGASIGELATFDTTDVAPTSSNQSQSLVLPSGTSVTLYSDQLTKNATNPNPTLAANSINYLNINGSYTQSFKYKCAAVSGPCSITYSLARNGGTTFVGPTTITPANGSGWLTVTNAVTASETGSQNGNLVYTVTCNTGPCKFNDFEFVEGTTLSYNTTNFRDDFIRTVKSLNVGGIRWMSPAQWCTYAGAQTAASSGYVPWCNVNNYIPYNLESTIGYDDMLWACDVLGISCYISVGQLNRPSDWAGLITWLSTNTHYLNIVAAGNTVYLANGNEAFNSAAGGSLYQGDGILYGSILGPNVAASRGASGYNATHMKLVGSNWFASNQSDNIYGWAYETLINAKLTSNGLPDFMEIAPYNFSTLNNCSTSGTSCVASGISTTGEPWTAIEAEISTFDTVATPPSGSSSVIATSNYLNSLYPSTISSRVRTMVYEMGPGVIYGQAATQAQLDDVAVGVGEALALATHWGLMQSTAGVTGPLGNFQIAETFNGFACTGSGCVSNVVSPVWKFMVTMPCGPGQEGSCQPQYEALGVGLRTYNNAIPTGANMMASTLSGVPTYSYAGGQPLSGTNTIAANSSVAYVTCPTWNVGSTWTVTCINTDPVNSYTVTIAGPGAPTGSVTQTVFGGPTNAITDNNEGSTIATLGTAQVVVYPSSTTTSGTTYTLPANSMTTLTYTVGGTTSTAPCMLVGASSIAGGSSCQ